MLRHAQFRLHSVQAVIYTPDTSQFSQSNLLATVLGQFRDRYNGSVEALPLSDDFPAEVPRVILQSSDGAYRIQASPARVDSFFYVSQSSGDNGLVNCTEVLEHYVRASQPPLRVGRLALVISRRADDANPTQSIIDRFCNEAVKQRPFNNSSHFEIHNHKRYRLTSLNLEIDSWVRCKAVTLTQPEQQDIALVEQDINTLEAEAMQNDFNPEQMKNFFASAMVEADSILQVYFPEEV